MKIESFVPQNSILSTVIECIYIIEQESGNSESFLILPSIFSYLSISLNTAGTTINNRVIVNQVSENLLDSSVQFSLKSSCVFEYVGKIKEICIKFKPLGIYDFFDEDILLNSANNQLFIPNDDYEANIKRILNYSNNGQIIAELEKYLLGKHVPFSHPYLKKAVNELEITDSEKPLSLEKLAEKLGVTRQTLNSRFNKYLNLSASEFRQICRFRKFIQAKLIDEKNSRLTDFVYDFGFFDQSHLIKEFKKYTFLKPNDFFRKINHSTDRNILVIWQ